MKVDKITIVIKTIPVELINSSRVGQVTLPISVRTSETKFTTFFIILTLPSTVPGRMEFPGQEGFEPTTCGFGDRRSSQLELLA